MNKTQFSECLSRSINRASLKLKKNSPTILLIAGIAGVAVSTVVACKATTKAGAIIEEAKQNIDGIHKVLEDPEMAQKYVEKYGEEYTEEESRKELAIVYAQTGLKLAKLYAPAVGIGLLSVTSILASHNILHKRNIALSAAFTAVNTDFKGYRSRVVERFGEALDRELKYNIKAQEIEEVTVDENGEETTVTKTVDVAPCLTGSEFARFYDNGCTGWTKSPDLNLAFLLAQQNFANDRLKAKGHVFLNEVYDMLGIQRSKAGQMVGWVYDEKNPTGDNFIDFGIFDLYKEPNRDFVNGYENVILLDFNVDGNILGLI